MFPDPIDSPGAQRDALIGRVNAELDYAGCAELKGFVRADRIAGMVAECNRVAVQRADALVD